MKFVVGNLKMNLESPEEADKYMTWLNEEVKNKKFKNTELVVCPPFVYLEYFKKNLRKNIKLGAQDCFSEPKGSFTGDISPLMLKNLGCEYVILGHSERRRYHGETEEETGLKVVAAIKNGLSPIICVGEKKEEREAEKTMEVITRQLKESLSKIKIGTLEKVVIIYEPVWSVGSDDVPTSNEIMSVKLLIQKMLIEIFGKKRAMKVRIGYGGSISPTFVKETCVDSEMDGGLAGRESLLPNELIKITQIIDSPC